MSRIFRSVTFALLRWLYQVLPESLRWRWARSLRSFARVCAAKLPDRELSLGNGVRIRVAMDEMIGSHLAFEGSYEPGLEQLLSVVLSNGGHYVDVGANIGHFTLFAAARVGPEGMVTAVEAIPETAARLRENIQLNSFDGRVTVLEMAAWHQETELSFNLAPKGRSGMSSIRPVRDSVQQCTVRGRKLDDAVPWRERPVTAIKFDVEGAEHEALLGASEIITEQRPYIFVELSKVYLEQVGNSPQEVCDLLETQLGYELLHYDQEGRVKLLRAVDLEEQAGDFQYNLVGVPRELPERKALLRETV